ncbi:MAG TPA: hypothetical protein VGO37_09560 [Steroidobacteraceae bacterium]|jgi:hypothetical protein|nr:hypothetical protein [Steroidobacteraceae bacterium]
MNLKAKALFTCGLMSFAPAVFAQYSLTLTGVGNGTVANGVYVSPYQGTVQGPGFDYAGYMICDDFNTESHLNTSWSATMTDAGALNGTEKFGSGVVFNGNTYSAQQSYNAVAWLANGLLGNLGNPASQTDYSFAIWNTLDGQQTDPSGGAVALEAAAFAQVGDGYVASNVSVFTPSPVNASQEFLVVTKAPEIDPAAGISGLTLLFGAVAVARGRREKLAPSA